MTDDEGFIHPAKSFKNRTSKAKDTLKFDTNNKSETLSNISDYCSDMDNTNTPPPEPKPQPIFMKMADNFSEIIAHLENTLNLTLKKKVNGDPYPNFFFRNFSISANSKIFL